MIMEALENPVLNSDAAEEAALLVASEEADKSGDRDVSGAQDEETVLEQEPAAEPEKAAAERPRDEQGRFTKTEAGEDIPDEKRVPQVDNLSPDKQLELKEDATGVKEDSEYTKARKDAERRDRSWAALNREKDEIRREREFIQRQQQLNQSPPQQQPAPPPPYSSVELAKASNDFEDTALKALDDGDYDAHREHLKLARQAREQAERVGQLEAQERQQQQMEDFKNTWMGVMHETIKANPDLANTESRLSKEVNSILLENEQLLGALPDGFARAKNQALLNIRAARADEAQSAYAKVKAENDRLNGLTGLKGSGPTSPPQGRDFDSLSLDEQMNALERASETADFAR